MNVDVEALVADQCVVTPHKIALQSAQRSITYADLARQTDSLAGRLHTSGCRRRNCVAVSTAQPMEAIVGFLAAMKVGATYLPLDASLPLTRKRRMLDETQSRFCVSAMGQIDRELPVDHIEVDFEQSPNSFDAVNRSTKPDQTDGAYLIYTSGSTGQPKGVVITRGNLGYSTSARHHYYRQPVGRFLLVSPLTFDSSVAGIYWTLTTGGTIVLPDAPIGQLQLTDIWNTIQREQVTHLLCIPSLWNLLLDADKTRQLASLQTVMVAGETCSRQLAARHHALLPTASLYNEYGPTEATVWCSVHRVTAEDAEQPVPIGTPIAGTRMYLLDSQRKPVAPGDEGELYVSGPGVAAGYLSGPELTAERFLRDPFSGNGTRMYKTGDFARQTPEGDILFLGRKDGQVKVRGHRIEIDEIECVLSEHPDVREAVVAAGGKESSDCQLVAFVVASNGRIPEAAELKEFAAGRLPAYMVPQRFVGRDSIARTRHGKIDRERMLGQIEREASTRPVAPISSDLQFEDDIHQQLAEAWQRILDRPRIGLDDEFFDWGGDSLRAMELASFIERRWKVQIELSRLLSHSTIRRLARWIKDGQQAETSSCLVPLQPQGTKRPLFCIHPGGGNVVCYAPLSRELGNDQPLYGIRAPGVEAGEKPLKTVEEMATEYIRLMQTVQPNGPYAIAGWSFGGIVAYEMACQLESMGQHPSFVGVIDGSPVYSIAVLREIFPNSEISLARINEAHADQYFDHFQAAAAGAMLVPVGASRDHTHRVLQLFASTMRAAVDYRAKSLDATMTLMVAKEKMGKSKYDPYQDWKRSCDTIDLHRVPGSHINMMQQPYVKSLARALRKQLHRSETASTQQRQAERSLAS